MSFFIVCISVSYHTLRVVFLSIFPSHVTGTVTGYLGGNLVLRLCFS